MKFYTEEGNWDLTGNNTPIFFIRDALLVRHISIYEYDSLLILLILAILPSVVSTCVM